MEGGGTPYSSSMAPSGSYILIIVSQPVTDDHKQVILDRLNKGLLSWDVDSTGCDLSGLETVCADITAKHLNDTDVLIQHSTESLGVEVLVSPTVSTLKQCVKNLFSTSTGHKHLIHAGYTFAGSGSWVLQNGAFSFNEFLDIFQQADVQSQKRCNIHVHCAELGPWTHANFAKDIFAKVANVQLNPEPKVERVPGYEHLQGCLERVLSPQALEEIMEASTLVGNIRFNRPTLYLFPAGQGDCALFGINGFNMLIDGGFNRKPCSWEFIRHLDRLDAVLVTRLCENNVCGMSTLMKRKSLNNTYPQIGYVFCNIAENEVISSPKAEMVKYKDDLVVSVVGEGHTFTNTLNELKLKPHNCWRDSSVDPFVLYHKVGHGTLEMHVLSPPKDSKEMKDFLSEWSSYKETFSNIKSGLKSKSLEGSIPLSHATSICAVLVWRPADPKDTITRILFPGSAPQSKIFESLEKLKALDVLKQPVVTQASLSVVTKTVTKSVEKTVSRASIPNRRNTASPALSVTSVASRNGDVTGVVKKEVTAKKVVKEVKKDNKDLVKKEVVKKEVTKKETTATKKVESVIKKDPAPKKEVAKEPKKEVKKIVKKETKEVKSTVEKKTAPKKTESASAVSKTVSEVKKAATTTVRKSTTPAKKEVSKPAAAPKPSEARKSTPPKASEPKTAKDVSNKKAAEAKSVPKTKPKTPTSKTATPKAKTPAAVAPAAKTTPSVTKAMAASSIVASAVAVTAAAFELNEKKDEIAAEVEPENISEKEPEAVPEEQPKEVAPVEKPEEVQETQMPPEALSPTPSESVSLTPSDTLSSAPLETVSPTPPLGGNEPMSMEEKEVNEIKEIDQDLETFEGEEEAPEVAEAVEEQAAEEEENDIEMELARRQKNDDMMSMSFVGMQDEEEPVEEVVCKTEAAPQQFASAGVDHEVPREEPVEIDEDKEMDSAEKIDAEEEIESEKIVESGKNEYDDGVENNEKDIDDQLAQMSMEGSFCAGRPYDQEILAQVEELKNQQQDEHYDAEVPEKSDLVAEKEEGSNKEFYEEEEEAQENNQMHQSFIAENGDAGLGECGSQDVDDEYENKEVLDVEEEKIQPSHISSAMASRSHFDDNQFAADQDKFESEEQEKEVEEEKYIEKDTFSQETYENKYMAEREYDNRYGNDDYQNIIADSEMQETSVDEPEEIVRKESAVSITLNDEEVGADYDDHMRRKSCTESEDDVDIQNYMSTDADNSLGVRRGSDSDNEDVVKSPTPHAIVDYDNDDVARTAGGVYPTEKQDFDEKDRDSAEDDGEMIRHPTPPGMKYSEDEMRDPIGPHFITTPGLTQQVGGITEEPLYEENEDAGSERSVSPVVEQPVFGNTAQADFPELVTVSGGTTPSEPQSPKSGFGSSKFGTDAAAVMDALSEHDCSESSAHSPLVLDEASAFDMPSVEEKQQEENLEKYSGIQDAAHEAYDSEMIQRESAVPQTGDVESYESEMIHKEVVESVESEMVQKEEVESYESEMIHKEIAESYESQMVQKEEVESYESEMIHKEVAESYESKMAPKEEFHESPILQKVSDESYESEMIQKSQSADSYESEIPHMGEVLEQPSAHQITTEAVIEKHSADNDSEDESYSQNDQSETRSEKSDIHKDDKSDNPHDGKSDAMDDDQFERRSDLHDDDRSDSHYDDKPDDYDSKGADSYDMQEGTRSHALHAEQYGLSTTVDYEANYEMKQESDMFHHIQREPVESSDTFDRQSFTEETSPNLQQGDEFDTNSASVSEISQIKTEAYEQQFEGIVKDDVNVKAAFEESNLPGIHDDGSKYLTSDDFNVPSGFKDEESAFPDVPKNDGSLDQFDSSPAHQLTMDAYKAEDFVSEKFVSTGPSQNDFADPLSKYESKLQSDFQTYKEDMDEEVRMVQQSESAVTHKYDEYSNFRSEMLQDNSNQQSYNLAQSADHSDDVAPQHTEGFSSYENKSLTEMTEARQYESLSKFEENVHTSTAAYSESSFTSNVISYEHEIEDPNFNYSSDNHMRSAEMQSEQTIPTQQENISFGSGSANSEFTRDFDHGVTHQLDEKEVAYAQQGFGESNFGSSVVPEQSTYHEDILSSETKEIYQQEYAADDHAHNGEVLGSETTSTFGLTNGSHTEYTTQFVTETSSTVTESHTGGYTTAETSYIINSRFHSDSPEDNIMRSDSSPDVPPYPLDASGQISDLKHFEVDQSEVDYSNMNVDGLPPSPVKAMNTNRDNYPASSSDEEDEDDSTSIPGTVSPYAYTNKAYAKEEEDMDGNHIYKESVTIEKTMQGFDDNNLQTTTGYTEQVFQETGQSNYDFRLEEWDKPMGLPTPPETSTKVATKKTAVKAKSVADTNGKAPTSKLSSSPLKKPKTSKEPSSSPVYLDLAYVPHHGDPQYCDIEFFKKIRARYYVFSGINPSKEVLNALLEAKKSWKEDLEVTIIPTYETDTLGYWMAQNQEDLAEYSIEVAPSASRCTVNLQDHATSCAAYRLEF